MSINLVVFVRSLFAFLILFIYTRLLGKHQIAELTFFDYVNGITIGSIAAAMSTDLTSIAMHHWVGLTTWAGLVLLMQVITLRNRRLAKLIQGEPVVVIHNGKILERNLEKARYPIDTLLGSLRAKDIFNIMDVEFAILEPSGDLSVQLKSQKRPVTPQDLSLDTAYEGVSVELIVNGVVLEQNLAQLQLDVPWLKSQLKQQGISDITDVFYAAIDSQGNLYIDTVRDRLQIPGIINPSDYPGPN